MYEEVERNVGATLFLWWESETEKQKLGNVNRDVFAGRKIGKSEKEIDAMRMGKENGMQGVSTQIHERKKTV